MITVLEKVQNENGVAQTCITQRQGTSTPGILQQILSGNDAETHYYKVAQKDLYDGNECYIRLIGNSKISRNPIQIILEKVKTQNITLGDICNVNQGILTGADKVSNKHIEKFETEYNVTSEVFQKEFSAENLKKGDQEYIEWAGELKIREKITKDLRKLKEIEYVAH